MVDRYAVVEKESGTIQNIIVWDGEAALGLPDTVELRLCDETFDCTSFKPDSVNRVVLVAPVEIQS